MIVVDTSVIVRIATAEPGADAALARIRTEPHRAAPDWVRMEVLSALSNKVRREGMPVEAARAAAAALSAYVPDMVDSPGLVAEAFELSLQLNHALYDCLYLAAALNLDGKLITADADFVKSAGKAGFARRVELVP